MIRRFFNLVAGAVVLVLLSFPEAAHCSESLIQDGDRIIFIGDSITGQGMNGGYISLIKEGLDAARPESRVTVIPLGGSGQGVGTWNDVIEKPSRENEKFLDIPNVGVKENLDAGAGIVVLMLGMNDSLSPYISGDEAGLDLWVKRYEELITAIRERSKPRLVCLGTITPNTEDPRSPKNLFISKMIKRLTKLAADMNCTLLPSGESVREVLQEGRMINPEFHVTVDYVHPNRAGHAAIAIGMLKGMGEEAAAEKIAEKYLRKEFEQARGKLPALSYTVTPQSLPLESDESSFEIAYYWSPLVGDKSTAKATLDLPQGWKCESAELTGNTGIFKVSGKLDHLQNILKLRVQSGEQSRDRDVSIPAPWLVGFGITNPGVWMPPDWNYTPDAGVLPGEDRLMQGQDFGSTPENWKGAPPQWIKYISSVDYTGGNTPGNVCLFAVSFSPIFEGAYGARWIHSDKEMPVQFVIGNQTFAGSTGVCVYLNGEKIYPGAITSEKNRKITREAILQKGWNRLVFKTNHHQWQWQFSLDIKSTVPGDVESLRVSSVPSSQFPHLTP